MYIACDLLNNKCNPCEHKTNLLEIDTLDLQLSIIDWEPNAIH